MNPQQNNGIPSIKQPGNWSPFQDYSNDMMPQEPKQSFFGRYKKLLIVSGVALVLLLGLAILASMSKKENSTVNSPVEMTQYSGSLFDMSYAKDLNIISDESDQDGGWALMIGPDKESADSNISVYVTKTEQLYVDAEDGLKNQQDDGVDVQDIKTSDVTLANQTVSKATGTITDEQGKRATVAFVYVKDGDNYIVVSAKYPEGTKNIDDSFDAMLSSIKLKS